MAPAALHSQHPQLRAPWASPRPEAAAAPQGRAPCPSVSRCSGLCDGDDIRVQLRQATPPGECASTSSPRQTEQCGLLTWSCRRALHEARSSPQATEEGPTCCAPGPANTTLRAVLRVRRSRPGLGSCGLRSLPPRRAATPRFHALHTRPSAFYGAWRCRLPAAGPAGSRVRGQPSDRFPRHGLPGRQQQLPAAPRCDAPHGRRHSWWATPFWGLPRGLGAREGPREGV